MAFEIHMYIIKYVYILEWTTYDLGSYKRSARPPGAGHAQENQNEQSSCTPDVLYVHTHIHTYIYTYTHTLQIVQP